MLESIVSVLPSDWLSLSGWPGFSKGTVTGFPGTKNLVICYKAQRRRAVEETVVGQVPSTFAGNIALLCSVVRDLRFCPLRDVWWEFKRVQILSTLVNSQLVCLPPAWDFLT